MMPSTAPNPKSYLEQMRSLLDAIDPSQIERYVDLLFDAWRDDRAVYVFGNGGSASCAAHHVADYVKTASVNDQPRLRAHCLSDNTEMLTAIGNDLGYDQIFRHALESYARTGDLVVAISCSGNSPNITKALDYARRNRLKTVAITGATAQNAQPTGGLAATLADLNIHIPSDNYGLIEDLQLAIGHAAAQSLRARIQAESASVVIRLDAARRSVKFVS